MCTHLIRFLLMNIFLKNMYLAPACDSKHEWHITADAEGSRVEGIGFCLKLTSEICQPLDAMLLHKTTTMKAPFMNVFLKLFHCIEIIFLKL